MADYTRPENEGVDDKPTDLLKQKTPLNLEVPQVDTSKLAKHAGDTSRLHVTKE